jgi:2-dehydropantoate 2-reductase
VRTAITHSEGQALVTIAAVNARIRVAVLGLGGVGGMLAARTGALCVGTERTVDAIRAMGLTLVSGETTTVAHPVAVERLEEPVSLLVVAVKAYDLDDALERISPDAVEGALVLPLLNGLEHVDTIRTRIRPSNTVLLARPSVAAGSIGRVEAFSPEPGFVVQRSEGATVIAASCDLDRRELDAVLEPLRVDGIEVAVEDDERAVLWEKAARMAVLAASTVASGATLGELRGDATWRARLESALAESCRVAEADGVPLVAAAQWGIIESLPADTTTSAARDAAAGRPTELDAITGSVVRAGARLGVATPVLAELHAEAACRAS